MAEWIKGVKRIIGYSKPAKPELKIDDLWMSLRSVIFMIVVLNFEHRANSIITV
jgi:hypothetical protein